ncbi:hypothetical protein Ancab_000021 [Ancistrocladus abbreviatus]
MVVCVSRDSESLMSNEAQLSRACKMQRAPAAFHLKLSREGQVQADNSCMQACKQNRDLIGDSIDLLFNMVRSSKALGLIILVERGGCRHEWSIPTSAKAKSGLGSLRR